MKALKGPGVTSCLGGSLVGELSVGSHLRVDTEGQIQKQIQKKTNTTTNSVEMYPYGLDISHELPLDS